MKIKFQYDFEKYRDNNKGQWIALLFLLHVRRTQFSYQQRFSALCDFKLIVYKKQRWIGPQLFLVLIIPHYPPFLAFYHQVFGNVKIWSFKPCIFTKSPQNFRKLCQPFQNWKKTIIFVPRLVQNHFLDQNRPNFPSKNRKTAYIS